ncbi:hypothetical protein FHW83_003056 [Duganella sp. SG902]|nr:hypothetical protein [Duganella sp. SG902]
MPGGFFVFHPDSGSALAFGHELRTIETTQRPLHDFCVQPLL